MVDITTADSTSPTERKLVELRQQHHKIRKIAAPNALLRNAPAAFCSSSSPASFQRMPASLEIGLFQLCDDALTQRISLDAFADTGLHRDRAHPVDPVQRTHARGWLAADEIRNRHRALRWFRS
jgi:hypothetical protein